MIKRRVGEEIKYQEWHYGKVTEVNDTLATIQLKDGSIVIKDMRELRTNKTLPKYIDFIFNKYRVRIKGVLLGMYDTVEEAVKVRDEYLKKNK